MKVLKKFLILTACIVFALVSGAEAIHHKVNFSPNLTVDTVKAGDGNVYSTVSFPGCSFTDIEGTPKLPVKTIKLIIPSDQEADKIELTKGEVSTISVTYPVFPVQKPVPTRIGFDGSEFTSPDKSIYQSENLGMVFSTLLLTKYNFKF